MPSPNPARDLFVAQTAAPGDAAFDTGHEDYARTMTAYIRSRSPEALAAIPRHPGVGLTLWRMKALTAAQRADALAQVGESRQRYVAFTQAVTERVDGATLAPDGTPQGGATVKRGENESTAEWVAAQVEIAGGQILDELGALALDRATVHPRMRDPFGLPWPLAPAR